MAELDPVSELVEAIENRNVQDFDFAGLATHAAENGMSPTNIAKLLAVVTNSTLSSTAKTKLLKECMIPKPQAYLPPDLYLKVLGCVGSPEVYYKNGKQHKSKRLALPLQQKLLHWLICVLPNFGEQVYHYTRGSLPLLFGLLSYEFSRPYISTFVIVGTCRQSMMQTKQKVLRSWHIQTVADLHARFPDDDSLILLLHHFSRIEPQLDLRRYLKSQQMPNLNISMNPMDLYASHISQEARKIRRGSTNHFSSAITEVDSALTKLLRSFTPSKRRKIDPFTATGHDFFLPMGQGDTVLINTVSSVPMLAKHFENIQVLNPSSVLNASVSKNYNIRCLFTSIRLLDSGPEDRFYRKMLFALKYHVLGQDASPVLAFGRLVEFSHYGGLLRFSRLITQFLETQSTVPAILRQKIELFRFADLESSNWRTILDDMAGQISVLYDSGHKDADFTTSHFLDNASIAIKKDANIACARILITMVFELMGRIWSRIHLKVKIAFMRFLRLVRSVAEIPAHEELMLPIPLFYRLLCSTNPLIVSETLGYASFLKSLTFAPGTTAHSVRKAFIMDCANLFWRDRAFQMEENTTGSGMFLDNYYLSKLGGLNYFSNSDLVSLKSVGNIIQNPCFSYICAEQVWQLEDASPHINCRHPGPLSEATIERFQRDLDVVWLNMTYSDIRLKIVRNLDEMGFKGLCDFLFSSIRSLADTQESSSRV